MKRPRVIAGKETVRYELQRRLYCFDHVTGEEDWQLESLALRKSLRDARFELVSARRADPEGTYRTVRITTLREVLE